MRRLILVRHAKSSWADPGRPDIDRPLNERGERNAPEMAARLRARGETPGLVVSSPARRALATARLMARAFGIDAGAIRIEESLYEASVEAWLAAIGALPGAEHCVLMVGHNPELTALANRLVPGLVLDNLQTCGVLRLDYAVRGWGAVAAAAPRDWSLDWPRNAGSPRGP